MGVNNRDLVKDSTGKYPTLAYLTLPIHYELVVPADQTDLEVASYRLPSDSNWELVSLHVWAKATSGSNAKTVNIQDDGTDVGTDTTVVAGAQTAIPFTAPKRFKGGSEVQLTVTTGNTTTITNLCATAVFRPFPMAEAGLAVA